MLSDPTVPRIVMYVYTDSMKKTTLEFDERLYEQAREALGTKGLKATVHGAFEEVLRQRALQSHLHRLRTGEGLDGPEVLEEHYRTRYGK